MYRSHIKALVVNVCTVGVCIDVAMMWMAWQVLWFFCVTMMMMMILYMYVPSTCIRYIKTTYIHPPIFTSLHHPTHNSIHFRFNSLEEEKNLKEEMFFSVYRKSSEIIILEVVNDLNIIQVSSWLHDGLVNVCFHV